MNRIGDSGNIAIESSRAAANINRYINHNRLVTYHKQNDLGSHDWVEVVSGVSLQKDQPAVRIYKVEEAIRVWKENFIVKFPTADQFDCVEWGVQPDIIYEFNKKGIQIYMGLGQYILGFAFSVENDTSNPWP